MANTQTPLQQQVTQTSQTSLPQTTGSSGTQYIDFKEKEVGGDTKPIGNQFDVRQPPQHIGSWKEAFEDGPQGWVGLLLNSLPDAKSASEFLTSGNAVNESYANNFMINYHSFISPIPIPLQKYITSIDIIKTIEAPYESCTMTAKMPFDFASALFAGEDGHPSTGGWILVRQKQPKDDSSLIEDFELKSQYEISNVAPALFFGVVSELSWNIFTDTEGTVLCEITINVNSFIHNLIHGEFRVSAIVGQDQKTDQTVLSEYVLAPNEDSNVFENIIRKTEGVQLNTYSGYETNRFNFNASEYINYIGKLFNYSTGIKDQSTSEQITKLDNNVILSDMIHKFAYPVIPHSLLTEPYDIETYFNTFLTDITSGTDSAIQKLAKSPLLQNLPPFMLDAILTGLIYLIDIAVNESQFYTTENIFAGQISNATTFETTETTLPSGGKKSVGRTRQITQFSLFDVTESLKNLKDQFKDSMKQTTVYEGLRLGDILHVVSTRNDVPVESELWAALPKYEIKDQDLSHIKNLQSKNRTIWNMLKGTFQTDDQLIEFYPTIIPLTGWSSRAKSSSELDQLKEKQKELFEKEGYVGIYRSSLSAPHPIWYAIGGIPAIVYRLKPMHPQLKGKITKEVIDKLTAYQSKLSRQTFFNEDMQYRTYFEEYIDNLTIKDDQTGKKDSIYNDNSYYEIRSNLASQNYLAGGQELTTKQKELSEKSDALKYLEQKRKIAGEDFTDSTNFEYYADNIIARPLFISPQQILSISMSQNDTLRINAVHVNDALITNSSGLIKYALTPANIVNTPSAIRHGLREYETTYPFTDTKAYESNIFERKIEEIKKALNNGKTFRQAFDETNFNEIFSFPEYSIKSSALAERAYMIFGDDQKYFRGTLTCKGVLNLNLAQGMWIEVGLTNLPKDKKTNKYDKNERIMLIYCEAFSHGYSVSQETGLVELTTSIRFSRGSIGAILPNFPKRRYNNYDEVRKTNIIQYLQNEALKDIKSVKIKSNEIQPIKASVPTETKDQVILIQDIKIIDSALKLGYITQAQYDEYTTRNDDGLIKGWPSDNFEQRQNIYIEDLPTSKQDQIKPEIKNPSVRK